MAGAYVIYYDTASDQLLAEEWLTVGPLESAEIRRLPGLSQAPTFLRDLLSWERQDWVITRGDQICCTVEISRHGYTGDNGFQRFARLYRAAQLHIPNIYFTPFSRTRTNELDLGMGSARNVAPELFQTLMLLSDEFQIPCLAVRWPTDDTGTAIPLSDPRTHPALTEIRDIIFEILKGVPLGSNTAVEKTFPATVERMKRQAAIPFRGTETRRELTLPVDLENAGWIWNLLPVRYFEYGKADKALASIVLRTITHRPLQADLRPFWKAKGRAWVLFLGYQWRPDPASGLVALAASWARRTHMRLIVVWPRVFASAGPEYRAAIAALEEFKRAGTGPVYRELATVRRDRETIDRFRERLDDTRSQYGVYARNSKVGRILAETAELLVLGDVIIKP